jgi:beta-glucanase (GH16 family)
MGMRAPGARGLLLVLLPLVTCGQGARLSRAADVAPTAVAAASGHWKWVWGDEFDGRRIDRSRWTIANTLGKPQYAGELNSYDWSEVDVAGGSLILRSRPRPQPRLAGTTAYISGRVSTQGKFAFLYGRVEIRAKLPGTPGVWPAIWMLPADGSWPPEVDVIELLGGEPRRVYMTNHYGPRSQPRSDQGSYLGPNFTAGYHVFTLEWAPGVMRWLVDGVERKVVTANVPDRAMYLIFNTAVGGDWPGPPNSKTVFPQAFLVDYVRVYQHRRG